jgi:hypothetical protein
VDDYLVLVARLPGDVAPSFTDNLHDDLPRHSLKFFDSSCATNRSPMNVYARPRPKCVSTIVCFPEKSSRSNDFPDRASWLSSVRKGCSSDAAGTIVGTTRPGRPKEHWRFPEIAATLVRQSQGAVLQLAKHPGRTPVGSEFAGRSRLRRRLV